MPGSVLRAAVLLLLAIPSLVAAQAKLQVWAVNDGEKVEKDDLNHPAKARNSVWDGRRVKLFGALQAGAGHCRREEAGGDFRKVESKT
jgi:hypothetical protein